MYAVNSVTGDVLVYYYQGGPYVGGTNLGTGLGSACVGKRGAVFVTQNTGSSNSHVYEFARGAVAPTRELYDPVPTVACTVNPNNGVLAAIGTVPGASGYGVVALYKRARGKPTILIDCCDYPLVAGTYDSLGNLYLLAFDGYSPQTARAVLLELPAGTTSFRKLNSDVPIFQGAYGGPQMQWVDGHLIVSSYQSADPKQPHQVYLYEFSISGSTATNVHTTVLGAGHSDSSATFFVYGAKVLSFTRSQNGSTGHITTWNYPAGGTPIHVFSDTNLNNQPQGLESIVVSQENAGK